MLRAAVVNLRGKIAGLHFWRARPLVSGARGPRPGQPESVAGQAADDTPRGPRPGTRGHSDLPGTGTEARLGQMLITQRVRVRQRYFDNQFGWFQLCEIGTLIITCGYLLKKQFARVHSLPPSLSSAAVSPVRRQLHGPVRGERRRVAGRRRPRLADVNVPQRLGLRHQRVQKYARHRGEWLSGQWREMCDRVGHLLR